ncbi:hypothetical protein PVK06_037834 [Gossypium arboreum]|uniref:RNase H type-1 domain-containing protein n=1 Tax=Gossypium arboreum TaxID=29729 RepID=A0ABR0MYG8_GOSAR|nr:hypothetical protein PVK06_037834 [Gossypium arboreum]
MGGEGPIGERPNMEEEVAELILRIPLVMEPHSDLLAWTGEPSGDVLWAIWGDRNARIHENTNRSGQEIAKYVLSYLQELEGAGRSTHISPKVERKWTHPSGQAVKINFDGAFDERNHQSASRIMVRDRKGLVLISCSKLHRGVFSPFAAEALACRRATQIGLEMQSLEVIIECDSLSVIKRCKEKKQDRSQIEAYIHDIQEMKSRACKLSFEYIPRSANGLAHILAKESLKKKEEMYLIDSLPSYADGLIRREREKEPN